MSISENKQPQEVAVRRLGDGEEELAVFEFQGKLRELMISGFMENYLNAGNYVAGAKSVSSQAASSIAVAGTATGAMAISASLAPTLYVATANPATLMSLGGGVGSAVMGTSGIVAQAPFIPIASSLPIVAPILAIQVLTTAVMMEQFKQVDQKLVSIKSALDTVLARMEAGEISVLLASAQCIDEIFEQYSLEGEFSHDMLARLAVAERDVRSQALRLRQLVQAKIDSSEIDDDFKVIDRANLDAHCAMFASMVDLRVSYLRVNVDAQENPRSVPAAIERLKNQIDDGLKYWESLQNRSQIFKNLVDRLDEESKNKKKVALPISSGKAELQKMKDAYLKTLESERVILEDYNSFIDSAKKTRQALDVREPVLNSVTPTLVYWKDENGSHSFVTEQNLIE